MKVVHLITATSGGAGEAAIRLHESLVEAGCDSKAITVDRRKKNITTRAVNFQDIGKFKPRLSSSLTALQRSLIQSGDDPVSALSFNTLDWEDPDLEAADILHLHAFYNLVSINRFLKVYPDKKKVVTLHDERFYTGGCHYSHDCLGFVSGCKSCPQVKSLFQPLVKKQKLNLENLNIGDSKIHFICPSNWILKRASEALKGIQRENFFHVYNPIPSVSSSLKLQKAIDNEIRFGFVSQNLDNPIKNLPLLLSAFQKLSKDYPGQYSLTLLGESQKNYSKVHPEIKQKSARNLEELYAALGEIDFLVVPSIEDNLPNVLGEALMNGVGIIGSNVGGIPEIVELFNQSLFQNGDVQSLLHAMRNHNLTDRMKMQSLAEEHFGFETIARKMMRIYSS